MDRIMATSILLLTKISTQTIFYIVGETPLLHCWGNVVEIISTSFKNNLQKCEAEKKLIRCYP